MASEPDEELKRVRILLEKVFSVIKLVNNERIITARNDLLKNETKHKIYELCDGKHTVKDIVATLEITQPSVSYHLSSLLEAGLVLYEDTGGNRYYFKTLE